VGRGLARASALTLVAIATGCGGAAKDQALRDADVIAATLPVYPGAKLIERDVVEYEAPGVGLPWEEAASYDRVLEYRLAARANEARVLTFFARHLGGEWTATPIERGIGMACWYRDGASVAVYSEDATPRADIPSYKVIVGTSQLGLC
jgi:hypothetical protein